MAKLQVTDGMSDRASGATGSSSTKANTGDGWRDELPHAVTGEAATERTGVRGEPLRWIMGAILAWGIVLAAGVVWYDYDAGRVNAWKPIVILAAVSCFLALWSYAIRRRVSRS